MRLWDQSAFCSSKISCRARAAALRVGCADHGFGVPVGSFVEVHVADVPLASAEAIVKQVNAAVKVKALEILYLLKLSPVASCCLFTIACVQSSQGSHFGNGASVLDLISFSV